MALPHRQKEKRETSCSSSVASAGSDPKDLDGIVLSFSSSPLPSPGLPLQPTTSASGRAQYPSPGSKKQQAENAPAMAASGRLVMQAMTAPNSSADKENLCSVPASEQARVAHLLTPASSATQPYRYSYPSHESATSSCAAHPSSSASSADASSGGVFVHRPHNSSIIAAKKHVRKRPLGSHAPLARTPSLPHVFAFPPSPPKSAQAAAAGTAGARPALKRSASYSLNAVAGREQRKSAAGLFANSSGDTVAQAADRRRASSASPGTVAGGSALAGEGSDASLRQTSPVAAPTPNLPMAMMTPVSKARARDELLQHMQSDPPSTSSPGPIPLTRRRIEALERSYSDRNADEDADMTDATFSRVGRPVRAVPVRPSMARSISSPNTSASKIAAAPLRGGAHARLQDPLHGRSSSVPPTRASDAQPARSSSPVPAAFGSSTTHAGANLGVCAVQALGRKRARILEHQSAEAAARELGSSGGRRALGLTIDVQRAAGHPVRPAKQRRVSAESTASSSSTDASSMADLSFSSTSTASTADSLVSVHDDSTTAPLMGDYFARPTQSSLVGVATSDMRGEPRGVGAAALGKSSEDEQRECAELLLGLGGFH